MGLACGMRREAHLHAEQSAGSWHMLLKGGLCVSPSACSILPCMAGL